MPTPVWGMKKGTDDDTVDGHWSFTHRLQVFISFIPLWWRSGCWSDLQPVVTPMLLLLSSLTIPISHFPFLCCSLLTLLGFEMWICLLFLLSLCLSLFCHCGFLELFSTEVKSTFDLFSILLLAQTTCLLAHFHPLLTFHLKENFFFLSFYFLLCCLIPYRFLISGLWKASWPP